MTKLLSREAVTAGDLTVDDLGKRVAVESDALGTRYGVIAAVGRHPVLYNHMSIKFLGPAHPLLVETDTAVSFL